MVERYRTAEKPCRAWVLTASPCAHAPTGVAAGACCSGGNGPTLAVGRRHPRHDQCHNDDAFGDGSATVGSAHEHDQHLLRLWAHCARDDKKTASDIDSMALPVKASRGAVGCILGLCTSSFGPLPAQPIDALAHERNGTYCRSCVGRRPRGLGNRYMTRHDIIPLVTQKRGDSPRRTAPLLGGVIGYLTRPDWCRRVDEPSLGDE